MKVDVFDLEGKVKGKIELPEVFNEQVREDLIRRAVLVTLSKHRQPYGVDTMAGKRTSAHYHGYRRHRYAMMNKEMARMPRTHGKSPPQMSWQARFVPQAKGGREAHPPMVEKIWEMKINDKERKKAIRCAIAATAVKDLVANRGHKFKVEELPIVVDDSLQEIKKTKELVNFFVKIGLAKELERIQTKKVRAGRGKMRGRKYKRKIGPLIVIAEDKGISRAGKNLTGVHVCKVENLSAIYLAPGAMLGRLAIFTQSAIEKMKKMNGE
jgi:large subunit ribosomal protein L4e